VSGRVIFLNFFHYPDPEERKKLDEMQEFLHFAHAEFAYQYRHLTEAEIRQRKEAVYQRARQRIGIVRTVDE
jgi:hypothetical protein